MEAVGGGFKPADAPNFAYQKWDIVDERFPTCPPSFREWMGVDDEDEEEAWANPDGPWFSYPPDYYDNRDLMDSRPMVYITLPNGKHYMVLMFGTETVLAVKKKSSSGRVCHGNSSNYDCAMERFSGTRTLWMPTLVITTVSSWSSLSTG